MLRTPKNTKYKIETAEEKTSKNIHLKKVALGTKLIILTNPNVYTFSFLTLFRAGPSAVSKVRGGGQICPPLGF